MVYDRFWQWRDDGTFEAVLDQLVIFKDNQPATVMMNVQAYQDLVDELEDLRI